MNSIKLLIIIAIIGTIAGVGILSNDIFLNAQSITVWDTLDAFSNGHECTCGEFDENGDPISTEDCPDFGLDGQECETP